MPRQKSFVKIKGTIDDLCFYESIHGHMVRKKGGITKERINSDPAFQRTRENMSEFREASQAGKLIRHAFKSMYHSLSDAGLIARLVKILSFIQKLDQVSDRGLRLVKNGIESAEGKKALLRFNFNSSAILEQVLSSPVVADTTTGELKIIGVNPEVAIQKVAGASHCILESAWARINFESGETSFSKSNPYKLELKNDLVDINLTPVNPPSTGAGVLFILIKVGFIQEVNGKDYSLNSGAQTALQIVSVS